MDARDTSERAADSRATDRASCLEAGPQPDITPRAVLDSFSFPLSRRFSLTDSSEEESDWNTTEGSSFSSSRHDQDFDMRTYQPPAALERFRYPGAVSIEEGYLEVSDVAEGVPIEAQEEECAPARAASVEHLPAGEMANAAENCTSAIVNDGKRSKSRPRKPNIVKRVFRKLSNDISARRVARRRHTTSGSIDHELQPEQIRENMRHHRFIKNRSLETVECISCFDDFAPKEVIKLPCHCYCKPCFQRLITVSLESEANWPPRCCMNEVPERTVLKYTKSSLGQRYRKCRREFSVPIEKRYYCPIADCGEFVPDTPEYTPYRRAKCTNNHDTCMDCHEWAHEDVVKCVANKEDMEMVQKVAWEEGWRRCYRCRTMIEHHSNCRHMTCRCGAQFCYVCGAVWFSCVCTEAQLQELKVIARSRASKRQEQERRQRAEEQELQQAFEQVAQMERQEQEDKEKWRAAKEKRRKLFVERKFSRMREQLDNVNRFQRTLIQNRHDKEEDEFHAKANQAIDALAAKYKARLENLQLVTNAGDGHPTPPNEGADGVEKGVGLEDGNNRRNEAGQGLRREIFEQFDNFRWTTESDKKIEKAVLQTKRRRLQISFRIQESKRQLKNRTEMRWYDLVVAERYRMLDELEATELAKGT